MTTKRKATKYVWREDDFGTRTGTGDRGARVYIEASYYWSRAWIPDALMRRERPYKTKAGAMRAVERWLEKHR